MKLTRRDVRKKMSILHLIGDVRNLYRSKNY
jgi:hypothetical protein